MRTRIGVDLGGTKIEAIVVDLPEDRARGMPLERARLRVATEQERGYEHIVGRVREIAHAVAAQAGVDPRATPIGVAMPGATTLRRDDGTTSDIPLVKNSNTTCLNGRPFRDDVARAVGRDVAFANDANCFALAEATWGAARGGRVVFGVIMGTGVGGGLVFAGEDGPRVWDGTQGIAGEWGHVALSADDGPPCYCGRRGCVETLLSGPAIERAYAARSGETVALVEIARRAASGDALASAVLAERVELFGRAIATVINVVDPDVVVLGGGVSNLPQLYDDGVAAAARWVFNDALETRIVKHALGDSAGVLGATLLPGR